jgi:23S rRNA (cytidine2498-2'-O)-methyltransferase
MFVFATCQLGLEPTLKADVAREHPGFRFAFGRPGLVTFKTDEDVTRGFSIKSAFARVSGVSFGARADAAAVVATARELGTRRLHVFARDPGKPGDERMDPAVIAAPIRAELLATRAFDDDPRARSGETVLDVIVAPDGTEWWAGAHVHGPGRSPWPGGRPPIAVPDDAPSRAFLKLEEAIDRAELPIRSGDRALELGCAPGGASHALLRRGLNVIGVDPNAMSPVVGGNPAFQQLKLPIAAMTRDIVPDAIHWLIVDLNLAPPLALKAVQKLIPPLRPTLLGAVFTLKLNDWALAGEIPEWVARIKAFGFGEVNAVQLPANRREITVVALTGKGTARKAGR